MTDLRGRFIVLDGTEGSGKSTQVRLLHDRLVAAGVDVVQVRDPGTTRIGERIRQILLDPANSDMGMRCEMLLYMAARAQMMTQLVLPAIESGKLVLCDRFVSSTLAYQLGGDDLTADDIRDVAEVAIQGNWPEVTIILDMPVEKSLARVDRERDRIEQRPLEYHQMVRDNYHAQATVDPTRYRLVDADRDVQAVHEDVWKIIESL